MKFFQTKKDRTAKALEESLIALSKNHVASDNVAEQITQTRIALLVLNGVDLGSLADMDAKVNHLAYINREIEQRQRVFESLSKRSQELSDEIAEKTFELERITSIAPDPEQSDWKLTPGRKAAILKAADNLKTLLERDPSPDYIETSRAAEEIQAEIDTNQY